MAKIKIKNSVTPGSVPAGLSFGEVAINIPDKKIFVGNAVESTVTLYDPNNHVLSFNGSTGAVSFTNYVASVNGVTGAITNVARTNQGNTFSVQQVMSSGITSSNLYVTSGGATFDSQVSVTTTTNAIDVVASTDGAGLRIAQATSGSSARVGGIRLGRSTVVGSNVYLEGYVGTFRVYNGISGTVASTGTKMLELSISGGAIFDIPIAGATFSSSLGRITVQKSAYVGSDSGTVRIIGADALSTQYNSDIRANASAAADTTHTLPATTGTLLNTASSYVVSVNGSTGAVTNVARTNEGNTFSVRQVMNAGLTAANLYVTSGATFGSAVVSDGGFRITSSAINAQTDSYSLQESDNGKIVTMNAATVKTITVPSGLSVGFNCTVIRVGAGRVAFSASGTTINSVDGLLEIASQHGAASLLSYASNTFNLSGNLA
jgi:hypothetical protein